MRIFDEKFKKDKKHFILQAALAGGAVAAALCLFDVVKNPMIVASFGSSAFGAFTMPHRDITRPRFLIGGYVVGIAVGMLVHTVTYMSIDHIVMQKMVYIIAGAIAVALAMFIMGITNTEHAPGASIALGFTLNSATLSTVILVLVGISVIAGLQRLLKRHMIDLI